MSGTTHPIVVTLRDGFFCKDGRGWHTSASGRGHSLDWPWPSTLLGAMRTAWGKSREPAGAVFTAPEWIAQTCDVTADTILALRRRRDGTEWSMRHRVWPAPLDALALEGQSYFTSLGAKLAKPAVTTLGRDDDPAREALWVPRLDDLSKPVPMARWWTEADFARWLAGEELSIPKEKLALSRRIQAHVGIVADTQTADEGILFAHDVVETLEQDGEWAMALRLGLPDGQAPERARIGSDGRLADLRAAEPSIFTVPDEVAKAFGKEPTGLRLVVVSPTKFAGGWVPDSFASVGAHYRGCLPGIETELVLRAAFVGRPVHISGWDMTATDPHGTRGAPKRTDRMVPPGSVYFFERADGGHFSADDARALWLAALGERMREGFGTVVPGVWTGKRS